jgi:Flp pilus assembly protein TadG
MSPRRFTAPLRRDVAPVAGGMRLPHGVRSRRVRSRRSEQGQVLAIFAGSFLMLLMLLGLVVDLGWLWATEVRVQRAADAGALAGVVKLQPDRDTEAITAARTASALNGFTHGVNGVTVAVARNAVMDHRLRVTVTSPVGTFFLRAIGITSFTTTRVGEADYTTPVPMGSPDNAYGIFGTIRTTAGGTTVVTPGNTAERPATSTSTDQWSSTPASGMSRVNDLAGSDNQYAAATATAKVLSLGNFGLTVPSGATVTGITLGIEGYGSGSGCSVKVDLSPNNGTSWTTGTNTGLKTRSLGATENSYTLGGASDLWNRASWSNTEVTNGRLLVRLTSVFTGSCTFVRVDALTARVDYSTTTTEPDEVITGPGGETLATRGFWAAMLSQGAETMSGDAYLPAYSVRTGTPNPKYDPSGYYIYDVKVPASTSGHLYIFDPGFCESTLTTGLGDSWYASPYNGVDAYYDLFREVNNTPYDPSDDPLVWSSRASNVFLNSQGSDPALGGTHGTGIGGCDAWHLDWYEVPAVLSAGAAESTYRLRTSTTNPDNASDQANTNAVNGFALYTDVAGGRIYGEGAMEMFSPLKGGQNSTFYLAQIDPAYAGRTMEIRLFDPGDTNQDANLSVLAPTASGWSSTAFSWTSAPGTTKSGVSSCSSATPTIATNLVTYSGGTSRFNGCWVTLNVPIPADYTGLQNGWWKIQYSMTGGAGTISTDITTWQVNILGNPVHLVIP